MKFFKYLVVIVVLGTVGLVSGSSERKRTESGVVCEQLWCTESCTSLLGVYTCFSDVIKSKCCDFYCEPTSTSGIPTTTTVSPATAGKTDAPTTKAVSTAEGIVCAGNLFSESLCQNRINTVPDMCDDLEWYGVCCTFCAASGHKRRPVHDVASLRRIRRQSVPSCTNMLSNDNCEAAIFASTFENKIDVCTESYMLKSCCGICSHVLSEGCYSDVWSNELCAAVVNNEGVEQCSDRLVADNCCLFCALTSLRAQQYTTTTTPTTTTTTIPTTTDEVVCEQLWTTKGCTSLLGRYTCSSDAIKSICCDFYCEPTSTSTTSGIPTTTTVSPVPTTTVTTTAPCFDDDANVCAQGVQNSLSFCYEAEDICCATCRTRTVDGLPESCAWGDKKKFCSTLTRDDCDLENVYSTCCALCGDSLVDPTAQPCLGDVNNYECAITIRSNPSRCYNSQFYSECCESCNKALMDYLPSGCLWGDKADFCDSSSTICNVFGDDVCCGSCCLDCVKPTTPAPNTTQ